MEVKGQNRKRMKDGRLERIFGRKRGNGVYEARIHGRIQEEKE